MAVRIPIKTEGGQQAADELKKVGDAGQSAMDRVNRASKEPAAGLKALNGVTSEVKGSLENLSGSAGVFGRVLSSLGPMGLAASAGIGALSLGLSKAIAEADEAQRAGLKVDAMLRATASASGMTRKSIEGLTGAISETTLATQDDLMAAATQLLAFKNVSGETFGEVLRLSQDLAAAGFGTLAGSAVALGKSLENPGESLKALKAIGIEFTDEQLKMLDAMVSSGRAAEAQSIILETLRDKIGGTGAAEADGTLAGAFHLLSERVESFFEKIGNTGPLSTFTDMVRGLADAVASVDSAVFTGVDEKITELKNKLEGDVIRGGGRSGGALADLADAQESGNQRAIAAAQGRVNAINAEIAALQGKVKAEGEANAAAQQSAKDARIVASEEAMMAKSREDATKRVDTAIDEHNAALKKEAAEQQRSIKARADAKQSLDDYLDSLGEEIYQGTLSDRDRAGRIAAIKAEADARKSGQPDIEAYIEAARQLAIVQYDQAAASKAATDADKERERDAEKSARDREKIAEQEAKAMRRPFEHAAEGIQDSFTNAFEQIFSGNVDNFEDFADQIKNVFTRLAAEIATLLVFNPQASIGSAVGGLGIFGSTAANASTSAGVGFNPLSAVSSFLGPAGMLLGAGALGGGLISKLTGGNALGGSAGGAAGLYGGTLLASGAAGGATGALVGALGTAGNFVIPGLGLLVGSLLGGALGKKGPSNKSAWGAIDLSTGGTANFGNMSGNKFSQQTVDARDAFFSTLKETAAALQAITGGRVSGTVSADIGQRDGTQISGTLIGTRRFPDPKTALDAIFKGMLDGMTGVSEEFRAMFSRVDTTNINKALEDLNAGAQRLLESAAKGKMRIEFDKFVSAAILAGTDPMQAALNEFYIQAADWRDMAAATGADIVNVEKMIGIKRAEILRQYGEQSNAGLSNAGLLSANQSIAQFLTGLRSGPGSFLSPAATLANAEADFGRLLTAARGGDVTARGGLTDAAGNLINASREAFGSSEMFFQRLGFVESSLNNLIGGNKTTTFDNIGITIAQGNATTEYQLKLLNDKVAQLTSVIADQQAVLARLAAA